MNKKNCSSNEIAIDENGLKINDQSSDYNSQYLCNVAKSLWKVFKKNQQRATFSFLLFNKSWPYKKDYGISNNGWVHAYQVTILSKGFEIALYETSFDIKVSRSVLPPVLLGMRKI